MLHGLDMPMTIEQKVIFLELISERKKVLFCRFDDVADGKRKKMRAWDDIRKIMEANGYVKSYTFLRDTDWSNQRTRTMAKRDKNNKTGAEPQAFDRMDELVFDIIGRETPVLTGMSLSTADTMCLAGTQSQPQSGYLHHLMNDSTKSVTDEAGGSTSSPSTNEQPKRRKTVVRTSRATDTLLPAAPSTAMVAIKERRILLQNRLLELQILKLETELDVEHVDI